MDNRNYDGILWYKTTKGYWKNNKYGSQHRYVYEKLTGLKVFDYQVVHHLDGDPSNNTAENLVCMTRADHAYLHSILDDRGIRMGKTNKDKTTWMKGKHHTEEAKRKNSEAHKGQTPWNKGKRDKLVICPYCKKEGGYSGMHRWHFDNCKNKGA